MAQARNARAAATRRTTSRRPAAKTPARAPRLRVERTFDAPRTVVWRAWTEKAHLVRWWGPDGFTTPHCEMDVRVGGRYRTCMLSPDGKEHWVQGEYLEVVPHEKLLFSWAWENDDGTPGQITTVKVELFDAGQGRTRLVLTHSKFATAESRDGHRMGWSGSLDCLARALA